MPIELIPEDDEYETDLEMVLTPEEDLSEPTRPSGEPTTTFPPLEDLTPVKISDVRLSLTVYGGFFMAKKNHLGLIEESIDISFQGAITGYDEMRSIFLEKNGNWICTYNRNKKTFGADMSEGVLFMKKSDRRVLPENPVLVPLMPEDVKLNQLVCTKAMGNGHIIRKLEDEIVILLERRITVRQSLHTVAIFDQETGLFFTDGPSKVVIYVEKSSLGKKRFFKCQSCKRMKAYMPGVLCRKCNLIAF